MGYVVLARAANLNFDLLYEHAIGSAKDDVQSLGQTVSYRSVTFVWKIHAASRAWGSCALSFGCISTLPWCYCSSKHNRDSCVL